jgi:hypothetical protein
VDHFPSGAPSEPDELKQPPLVCPRIVCREGGGSRQPRGKMSCIFSEAVKMREGLNRLNAHPVKKHVARPVAPSEKAGPCLFRTVGVNRPVKERNDVCRCPIRIHAEEKVRLTGERDASQQAIQSLIPKKGFVPRALNSWDPS